MTFVLAFFVSFVSVFLKGFQHKNVIAGDLRFIAVTSYLMAFTDVLIVGLVVSSGWTVSFACGTGAALGMVLSVKYHGNIVNFFSPRSNKHETQQSNDPTRQRKQSEVQL